MRPAILTLCLVTGGYFILDSSDSSAQQTVRGHFTETAGNSGLTALGPLEATNRLALAVALPLRNRESLAALLNQLYDPNSANFHRFLRPEEFAERFGPSKEDYQALVVFAGQNGFEIVATHPNRALLDVRARVSTIETALHVNLRRYRHPNEARSFFAPDAEPRINLAVPILHIAGLDDYVQPQPLYRRSSSSGPMGTPKMLAEHPAGGSAPGGGFLGNDFRAAYCPGTVLTGRGQTVGLVEFNSGFFPADIASYEAQAGLPAVPVIPVLLDGYDGSPGGSDVNAEVSLDIETAISMAPGLDQVLVYEGALPDDILNRIATDGTANQISASWGYATDAATEQIYQQLAAQGQSFFNASGDGDAWLGPIPYGSCEDANITIVGGTTLATSSPGGGWTFESVWNWGNIGSPGWNPDGYVGSSGGVSADVPIPAWQQGLSMSANHGSTTLRNVPDVALTADNVYVVYDNGVSGVFGGTSCAAPLWAGYTALANELASAGGQPPAGFLNPALYSLGRGSSYATNFHDITSGNNFWDRSPTNFPAVPGFDLCTGWGTPAGGSLLTSLARPDSFQVFPVRGFDAVGAQGGPFNPPSTTLTLTNTGSQALNWTVSNPVSWLDVSGSGGTLPAHGAYAVTVSLNAAAAGLAVGNYSGTVWFTNLADSVGIGRRFTLAVLLAPFFVTQPSSQGVIEGAPATFSVTAGGSPPLSYQWWTGGTNLADNSHIHGSTTSTLTISNVTPSDLGPYFVTVSNTALVVTSAVAQLSIVSSPPVLLQQPVDQTVPLGATVRFTVSPCGDPPFSYQWTFQGTNLPGASDASLILTNVQFRQSGYYAVAITNGVGGMLSSNALLTVVTGIVDVATFDDFNLSVSDSPPPPDAYDGLNWSGFLLVNGLAGVISPLGGPPSTNNGYCAGVISASNVVFNSFGGPASFSASSPVNLVSAYLTAAWNDDLQVEAKGYIDGALIYDSTFTLSATAPTRCNFNFQGVTEVDFASSGGTPHRGYDMFGTQFVMDNMVFVPTSGNPINITPVIYEFGPESVLLSPGQDVSLWVQAVGAPPLRYQWRMNGTNLPGATESVLTLTNAQLSTAGNYSVLVTNQFGNAVSGVALVTVASAPEIVAQPQDQLTMQGAEADFTVSAVGAAPLSYQWRMNGTNLPSKVAATLQVINADETDNGGYDVVVTNNYGSVTSRVAALTVLQSPGLLYSGSDPVVFFPSSATTNYVLQMTADPVSGAWTDVTNGISWTGLGTTTLSSNAFFRLNLGATTVTAVAAGYSASYFLESDGSLWGMGACFNPEAGAGIPGTAINRPQRLVVRNVMAVSAGTTHALYLKSDGSLWAAGDNSEGELGDGTFYNSSSPEQILASNVTAVAAGAYHSVFLKRDGSLWAMGANSFGQLGDGSLIHTNVPERIVSSNVVAIAAQQWFSLFLKRDGTVWGMGYNGWGQLDGGTYGNNVLKPQPLSISNVVSIAGGDVHSLFLKQDGSLWVVGGNPYGELGENLHSLVTSPEQMVPGGVASIGPGRFSSFFVKSNGSLWATGYNASGQLGDGTTNNVSIPKVIAASNVAAVSSAGGHTLVLSTDGSLWATGDNYAGDLGDGTQNPTNRLEEILSVPPTPAIQLSLGTYGGQAIILFPTMVTQSTSNSTALNFQLESATDLTSSDWNPVTNSTQFTGLELPNLSSPVYFRLYPINP